MCQTDRHTTDVCPSVYRTRTRTQHTRVSLPFSDRSTPTHRENKGRGRRTHTTTAADNTTKERGHHIHAQKLRVTDRSINQPRKGYTLTHPSTHGRQSDRQTDINAAIKIQPFAAVHSCGKMRPTSMAQREGERVCECVCVTDR